MLGPNDHHRLLSFLLPPGDYNQARNRSMLIYGQPGTYKSRLAATVSNLLAVVYQAPVLYFSVSEGPGSTVAMCQQIATAWPLPFEPPTPVYYCGDNAAPETGPQIRICGLSVTWKDLIAEIISVGDYFPQAAVIVVDSMGMLGSTTRLMLSSWLRPACAGRFLILVGEESADPENREVLDYMRSIADIVVRLGMELPQSNRRGPLTRYIEFLKLAHNGMIGRHSIQSGPDGMLMIFPACEFWSKPEQFAIETRRASKRGHRIP